MKKLVETMFWIENQIQLCHWQEKSGYKHEILGKFYEEIIDQIDRFVESSTGCLDEDILNCGEVLFKLINNYNLIELVDAINTEFIKIREQLVKLEIPELINIVDEIQGIVKRNKYLLQKN